MRIVIIGAGKIGKTIIKHVSNEGHEVVVVDKDSNVIEYIVDQYDVMGLVGNGCILDIQKQAGVDRSDIVIAATKSDEANILCCLIAKNLGTKCTIARIRDYEYSKQINMLKDILNIDVTINPELESAKEISRILNFPNAIHVDSFSHGKVELLEFVIPDGSPLVGQSLAEMNRKNQLKALVCVVQRDDDVIIPKGNFVFEAKDRIHITCNRNESIGFMEKLGLEEAKLRDILIIGGGKISIYLAEELIKNKYNVKIIESSKERCLELTELLPKATIICGDGSDQRILKEEGMDKSDAVVCLTGNDEENIIISLYANKKEVKKIITKINKLSFGELMESVDMASIINSMEITANQIVSFIRATSNRRGNSIKKLYKLVNNKAEALEFEASSKSKVLDKALKDLKLKPDVLIAGLIRDGIMIVPTGSTMIMNGDSVIVVASNEILNDLDDILV